CETQQLVEQCGMRVPQAALDPSHGHFDLEGQARESQLAGDITAAVVEKHQLPPVCRVVLLLQVAQGEKECLRLPKRGEEYRDVRRVGQGCTLSCALGRRARS